MTAAPHSSATTASAATAACPWARHLMAPTGAAEGRHTLSAAEANRVQRHRDQIMAALQAQDRRALWCAKQAVLDAAFHAAEPAAAPPVSPALRGALRDLAWRMAGLLLPRGARPGWNPW